MTDIASRSTVRILERKSNRTLADVSGVFRSAQWTGRWRRSGTARLAIAADDLPRAALAAVVSGNAAVFIAYEWEEARPSGASVIHSDVFTGPLLSATVRDGDFLRTKIDYAGVRNEIVVLGAGEAAARDVTRRWNTASQSAIGLRELALDARNLSTTAQYEARGDAELAKRLAPARSQAAGGQAAGGYEWELWFADNLRYPAWRVVDTDAQANIDPGTVKAGEYIGQLLEDNLIAPALSRRQIDVPAVIATPEDTVTVDLPVRWPLLLDAIEQACIAADCGIVATLDSSERISYQVRRVRNRTSGTAQAVIWNRENMQREWDVLPGDRVTVEEYLREDSDVPDIGPYASLCVARTVTVTPDAVDVVKLEFDEELPTEADLFKALDRRTEAARFI